jgi:AAA15 family ATPase/GTPase
MLIQFTVKNYKSIRDEHKLSLVAATGDELKASNTFLSSEASPQTLLRAAVIYGANASGKSTLLQALDAMQTIVLESASTQSGKLLPVTPFLLDQATVSAATEFEVVFLVNGVRYQYGFAATQRRITEEWLFVSPKGRAQHWFNRAWDAENNNYVWEFSKLFTGEKQLWQKSTRDNALFLSTATQLNSKSLAPVFIWFAERLHILRASDVADSFTAHMCKQAQNKANVLAFLKAADIDIADVNIEVENLAANVADEMLSLLLTDNSKHEVLRVRTIHQDKQGKDIEFALADESDGTRKLFAFAGPLIDTLQHGNVLLIDELHNSLHPKLVLFLLNLLHANSSNPNNAQLVFTTHDTAILNQSILRRDQIWFVEKDQEQASQVFPLTDFHPRKDRENLLVNYMDGRYGALPVFGAWELPEHAFM